MKLRVNYYAIYDKKAETYGMPFPAHNDAVAARMVSASMDGTSMLTKYPSDYRLDRVAEYENTLGMFICDDKKVIVSEVSNITPLPFDDGVLHDDREG